MFSRRKLKSLEAVDEMSTTYDHNEGYLEERPYGQVSLVSELREPSPSVQHQLVCKEIGDSLSRNCQKNYLILFSPIDLILSEQVVLQPDLLLIHRERIPDIVRNRGIIGPPDLVVEILSPDTIKKDKVDKLQMYSHFEIPEYWIVDPTYRSLEVYEFNGTSYQLPRLFTGNESIDSSVLSPSAFTMNEVFNRIIHFPEGEF